MGDNRKSGIENLKDEFDEMISFNFYFVIIIFIISGVLNFIDLLI